MGKGSVKGSKRKRHSSPPPVNKSSKRCSASDSESATMGLSSSVAPATVKIKGRTSTDSDTSVSVEMKGRSSSDSDSDSDSDPSVSSGMNDRSSSDGYYTCVSTDTFPWSCRVRIASGKWFANDDGEQPGSDMGKGGAKRKRHQPVKGSKRKRYSSPPLANKSSKRCPATDSDGDHVASSATMGLSSRSDMGKGGAKRKRRQPVKGSKRKLHSSPHPVNKSSKRRPTTDSDGVSEDLAKVGYIGTTASGGDEQVQRTKNLSHIAFPDIKQSGFKEFDVKNLAKIFELQGNEAMQSKLYPAAIECYNVAIAFGGDNAIYYFSRAAAYIQTCQYAEAILDCQKSIAVDPNYINAYTRLGYIYFVQGLGALEKGYRIATLLHPSVRENVRSAEHKIWQQREESGQDTRLRASDVDPSDTNPRELYEAIRADISFLATLHLKTNNSNEN